MGAIVSCIVTSITFCFCSACGSLLESCLGNDKPSTVPASATSGRKRSCLLLLIALIFAFGYQYGVAPAIVDKFESYLNLNSAGAYIVDSWIGGCEQYDTQDQILQCSGNSGVFRVSFACTVFFIFSGLIAFCKPTWNREAWPAKYILFMFMVGATAFIPNQPTFYDIYLHVARIGASIFIIYQQIIFIDMAYNWNESWVEKSNDAEIEKTGSGKKWLAAILVSCGVLFSIALTTIGLCFHYFRGCKSNIAFISVTLVLCIIITVVQLLSEEGSLLTSAVVSAYACYLVYTAISKNPNEQCNPLVNDINILNIVVGVFFTAISMIWTGFSSTAEDKLVSTKEGPTDDYIDTGARESYQQGIVVNDHNVSSTSQGEDQMKSASTWMINGILALVSCWFAMTLTSWGSITAGGNFANPSVGNVSMWMIMSWQWLALVLYLWTLVAPKLFPDRDFS